MLRRLVRRAAALVARTRFENDMQEELRSHIEHRTDDLVAAGSSREVAARQARLEFGALEAYKEKCRDSSGFAAARITFGLWGDVTLAVRRLRAAPLFLAFAVLSLGAGAGITITAYAVVEEIFWKPLGVFDSGRIAVITERRTEPGTWQPARLSRADFEALRAAQRSLQPISAAARFTETLASPAGSDLVIGEAVSGDYFAVVGVQAAVGRTIQAQDERARAAVLVLSDTLWRARFGADPRVVGRVVNLGGHPFEIVGVAPRTFNGTSPRFGRPLAWVPLSATALFPGGESLDLDRQRQDLMVLGRLPAPQTMTAADAEARVIASRLADAPARARNWSVHSIDTALASSDPLPLLLVVIIGLVLLVACTNLANLILARGTMRQHDFAVRRALGASRWRLIRGLCVESGVIALLGGVAAIAATRWMLLLLPTGAQLLGEGFAFEPRLSVGVLLAAAGMLLASLLIFGLEPALQLTRQPVTTELATEGRTGGAPRAQRQRTLIRWQVAICTCFFLITSILGRVVVDKALHDSGVDVDRLGVATVAGIATWDQARLRRAAADTLAAARQQPGIEAAAVSAGLPFGVRGGFVRPAPANGIISDGGPVAYLVAATPDIFRTLGIPILAGRAFDDRDNAASAPVVVISEVTSRQLFRTTDTVGRQIMYRMGRGQTATATIIGLSRDTDTGTFVYSRENGVVYMPLAQHPSPLWTTVVARTSGDPRSAAQAIQAALRSVDPDISASSYGPASVMLAGLYLVAQLGAIGAAALGALTLLLGMVGLYGVQAQVVAHRTREVGVRLALGATARQIERMVLGEGFRPVVQGLALGLLLGSLARLAIRAMLDVPIALVDPVALVLVPIPLAFAAFVACRVPAHRAARVEPCAALRHL